MRHLPHWHQSDLHTIPLSDQCGAYGKKNWERLWPAVLPRVRLTYLVLRLLMTSLDLSQSVMIEDYPKFTQTSCSVWNELLHSANCVFALFTLLLCWEQKKGILILPDLECLISKLNFENNIQNIEQLSAHKLMLMSKLITVSKHVWIIVELTWKLSYGAPI